MRRLPLLLTTLALVAPLRADETAKVKDEQSGLVVEMPAEWTRETAREKGSVKFSAIYDLTRTKYVLFQVETGPAENFVEAAWLDKEKEDLSKFLKTVDTPWSTESATVGGEKATRYTLGGKTEKGLDVRFRGCGFVKNDYFFRIQEVSQGGAHAEAEDAVKAIWEAVRFEEPNPFATGDEGKEEGSGEEEPSGGKATEGAEEEAPKGEPIVIEDKAGNFKVKMPPGWSIDRAPQEDDGTGTRLIVRRAAGNGDAATMEFFRISVRNSEFFDQNEAAEAVEKILNGELHFFDQFYGDDFWKTAKPEIDTRQELGKARKSCGYEVRSITLEEDAKVREAEALVRRGDTSVKVPEYKPLVIRGRLAMLSPFLYVTVVQTARSVADDEKLLAEIAAIHDSFEFATAERMPPPLASDTGPFGNTLQDPANAEERKGMKMAEFKKGAKVAAAMKFDYILPPGFQDAERVADITGIYALGDVNVVQVIAQDGTNGWVWIRVTAQSSKELGSNEKFIEKKKVFEEWISNFESQARGAGKMPKKPENVRVGNIDGDGCELEGKINGFHATEINMVTDTSGWRIRFELKTRGTGAETFADGIKTFLRKFKATKK
ncbi:MAG TPA: hypothetical protein VFY93_09745 [Planctomycetota bacterium]|nr:hypothetical protein [Planctomycetota bacterium]